MVGRGDAAPRSRGNQLVLAVQPGQFGAQQLPLATQYVALPSLQVESALQALLQSLGFWSTTQVSVAVHRHVPPKPHGFPVSEQLAQG